MQTNVLWSLVDWFLNKWMDTENEDRAGMLIFISKQSSAYYLNYYPRWLSQVFTTNHVYKLFKNINMCIKNYIYIQSIYYRSTVILWYTVLLFKHCETEIWELKSDHNQYHLTVQFSTKLCMTPFNITKLAVSKCTTSQQLMQSVHAISQI